MKDLQFYIDQIQNAPLYRICMRLKEDISIPIAPASTRFHHAYAGGLLQHILEVAEYALASAAPLNLDDESTDVLIASCLWHDALKIYEYESAPDFLENTVFQRTQNLEGIGHICAGAVAFSLYSRHEELDLKIEKRVVHCILAHHGRPEWGSPVEPQTVEALLLHQADMLSAKFGKTKDAAP